MSEGRLGLILAFLSLLVSSLAFSLPFYYEFLRERHDLRLSMLGYNYNRGFITVSVAFLNRGTGDEVILDWSPIAGETTDTTHYTTKGRGDLLNPYGDAQFVIHRGDAVVKRMEWPIKQDDLPGL